MATSTRIEIAMQYTDDSTRQMTFSGLSAAALNPTEIETKINAINASLAASTDGGLAGFFLSDGGASFAKISEGQIVTVTETAIEY